MKTVASLMAALLLSNIGFQALAVADQNNQQGVPPPTAYSIVENEANSRVWQRVTYETGPNGEQRQHVHKYTELATGLNHLVNGQWVESKEEIDVLPDGSAAATNGQHQVYFPADIYQGQIELVMPDGTQLHSRPMGMSYDDGTNTVLIAALTNSVGQLLSSNQVIYPNAFVGFNADLLYTYTKAGLEQDVVLRQQPPTPEQCGLSSQSARLQLLTEFFSPPEPVQTTQVVSSKSGLSDTTLNFGTTVMVRGKAFLIGDTRTNKSVRVCKSWQHVDGRTFLVEEVPVAKLERSLETLPPAAITSRSASPLPYKISTVRQLTPQRLAQNSTNRIQLARADVKHGVVLDYVELDDAYGTNFTFQGDTTYYINGSFGVEGDVTFEGGTVIKYYTVSESRDSTLGGDNMIFKTSAYRPAVFTAYDDDTVGEVISGSDGNPGSGWLSMELIVGNSNVISNCRFCYSEIALDGDSEFIQVQDCQFLNCDVPCMGEGDNDYTVRNVLVANCVTAFSSNDGSDYLAVHAENLTVDAGTFIQGDTSVSGSVCLTNCIIVGSMDYWNSVFTNLVVINPSGTLFQSVGGGNYYLTNGSSYRNAGTTNICPALLADLATKTTWPPIVYSNVTITTNITLAPQAQRDTGAAPDLGYHYDPIDYIVDYLDITNALLTVTNGAAIASYNDQAGIWLENGSSVVSIGTPLNPNWFVRYSSVQEESVLLGPLSPSAAETVYVYYYVATAEPTGFFRFTKFACLAGGGYHIYDGGSNFSFTNLLVQDCEFWSGGNGFGGYSNTVAILKNNLFARSTLSSSSSPGSYLFLTNNLFWGVSSVSFHPGGSAGWYAFDNDFDSCTNISSGAVGLAGSGYNAYLNSSGRLDPTNAFDIVTTNALAYQTGPLGTFYQPTNSLLINMGSTTADQVGLYHYTVTTNEVVESTNTVSIGYHYVATDANGNPLDSNDDGIPDYLEDANGDGLANDGERSWWQPFGLNFNVLITRPKSGSPLP